MIGERVRLAREATRLTQTELASLATVSQGTLSAIEAGRFLEPDRRIIKRIAETTLYPENFFYLGDLPDIPDGRFRRRKKGTSKVSKQVRAQVRQIVDLLQRTEPRVKLPPIRIDAIQHPVHDFETIESIAAAVREDLGVGSRDPIPNLTRAIERAGVVVVRLPGTMEDHDGFSVWPDYGLGGRPVIAITITERGDRDRFNIAHEIGHLVLHTVQTGTDPAQAELQANRFAGALLIPHEAAIESMRPPVTLRVLLGVKATFGTSVAMTARRARDLNLISQDHYESLQKQMSTRGWRRQEPVEVRPENPLLIAKVIDLISGQGSTAQRALRVGMPVFAFSALARAHAVTG